VPSSNAPRHLHSSLLSPTFSALLRDSQEGAYPCSRWRAGRVEPAVRRDVVHDMGRRSSSFLSTPLVLSSSLTLSGNPDDVVSMSRAPQMIAVVGEDARLRCRSETSASATSLHSYGADWTPEPPSRVSPGLLRCSESSPPLAKAPR
jgi:hypothetical protein